MRRSCSAAALHRARMNALCSANVQRRVQDIADRSMPATGRPSAAQRMAESQARIAAKASRS